MAVKQMDWTKIVLPDDIAIKIASSLQVSELCALGCCSKFWRELCGSDCLWVSLSRNRWPSLNLTSSAVMVETSEESSSVKGWKGFYIKRHNEMADKANSIVKLVEDNSSSKFLEVGDFVKAVQNLCSMNFAFKDIEFFFFTAKQNVLLNLVGLHYCIFWLKLPIKNLIEALKNYNIAEREVCVNWWKLGRWFYGFRMRDESRTRRVSLGDLAMAKENEVLGVLHRGAIHEVLRVNISIPDPGCVTWVWKDPYAQA